MQSSQLRRATIVLRLATLALASATLACGSDPIGPPALLTTLPRELTADEISLQNASNSFSFRLLGQLSKAEANKNLFLSPLSVSFALGMANNGASGETRAQISQTLGFGTMSEAAVNEGYRGLISLLKDLDPNVDMEVANSVWYDNLFGVQPTFISTLSTFFDASVTARDFGSSSTLTDINNWVSDHTRGKIPTIIDMIDSQEIMFLINAIYFRGDWRVPFDPRDSRAGVFHTADGRDLPITLMSRDSDSLQYVIDGAITAVNLPYGNGAFSMALIRPTNSLNVNALTESLSAPQWADIRSRFHEGKAVLTVPRFKLEYKRALKSDLQVLGMVRPFEPDLAEFPGIPTTPQQLFISRVQHRAAVEVDEVGTTAAAATAVGIGVTSAPPQLDFDRPFVFVIYERISGTILFVGKVVELP